MNETIIILIAAYTMFIIIYIIMEFKADNFIPERNSFIWFLLMMISSRIITIKDFSDNYYPIIPILFLCVALAGYLVFQKNKIYLFKGIDKKLINENRNEINEIIKNYKNNYIDDKLEITFLKNRLVFEGVSKTHIEKCLLLIGNFLDENRKNYTLADYVIYILKSWVIPLFITLAALFIFIKLMK